MQWRLRFWRRKVKLTVSNGALPRSYPVALISLCLALQAARPGLWQKIQWRSSRLRHAEVVIVIGLEKCNQK